MTLPAVWDVPRSSERVVTYKKLVGIDDHSQPRYLSSSVVKNNMFEMELPEG